MARSKIEGIIVEIGGDATGLKKALNDINKSINSTQSALREVDKLLKLDPSNTVLLEQKQRLLASAISDTESKLDTLKKASEQAAAALANGTLGQDKYDALQREIIATENKLKSFKDQANNVESSVKQAADGMEQAFNGTGDAIDSLGGKLDAANLMEATDQLSSVGDALLDLGSAAMEAGQEWGDAMQTMQANLGITADEAENLKGVAQDVFETGIAESADEAAQSVMLCKQSFGELSDTDLTNLSNQLLGISTRTGTDIQENARGAAQMMTAFGITGQEALDLIAAGYQENLNRSGDFADTLNEYSGLFADAGFSADQMLSVLSAGMQNGAFNTDKVADAIKELQIRMGDGTFEAAIGSFSTQTQNLFAEWQNGSATFSEVANSIGQDLEAMTPTEQQAALTTLSTQFEDLGVDASIALLQASDGFEDATGKAQEFAKASPGEEWQGSLNTIKDSLGEVGTTIMETFQPVLDVIAQLAQWFAALPAPIQTFITVFGGVIVLFTTLAPIVTAAATAFGALNLSLLPIAGVIAGIVAAIVAVIAIIKNWGEITEWLSGMWDAIKEKASQIWTAIKDKISEIWDAIKQKVKDVVTSIKDTISNIWNSIKNTISNVLNGIKNTVSNIWNSIKNFVSNTVSNIKNTAVNAFTRLKDGIKNTVSKVADVVKDGFNKAIDFIKSLPGKALQWGKDFIGGLIDGIKSKVTGIINTVKDIGNKIREFLHFSRPDKGPLHDYETWMPDFMAGLAKGIKDYTPLVTSAVRNLANDMSVNMGAIAAPTPAGTTIQNETTVYIGNKKFDGYIVETASRGIGNNQRNAGRARGR